LKVSKHYNVSSEKVSKLKLDGTDSHIDLSRALNLPIDGTNFSGVNDTIKKLRGEKKIELDSNAKKLIDFYKTAKSSYSDMNKMLIDTTPKCNLRLYYDGKDTGLTIGRDQIPQSTIEKYGLKYMEE